MAFMFSIYICCISTEFFHASLILQNLEVLVSRVWVLYISFRRFQTGLKICTHKSSHKDQNVTLNLQTQGHNVNAFISQYLAYSLAGCNELILTCKLNFPNQGRIANALKS